MRVLLDECLPLKLMGWAGLKNGELLQMAAGHCDVFITIDRTLPAQQRVDRFPFGLIVIGAPRNDIDTLRPLMPSVDAALEWISAWATGSNRVLTPVETPPASFSGWDTAARNPG